MLYARQTVLPIEANTDSVDIQALTHQDASTVVLTKADKFKDIANMAVGNIAKAQAKQQRDYKAERKYVEPTNLKPGDYIVLKAPARQSKLAHKAQEVILMLEAFANEEKTMVVVRDSSQPLKRWKENVSNIAKYEHLDEP